MAEIDLSRFKIALGPESNKVQGLRVGDIALRRYFDNTTQYYSLLLVENIGNTVDEGDYFIGKLLDGDEPGATGNEVLDFVRVTNLFDRDRMGALYMTASESNAPFVDVLDALGREKATSWPEGVDSTNGYWVTGAGTYGSYSYDDTNRTFRITRNSTVAPNSYSLKSDFPLRYGQINIGKTYILSYKYRASKSFDISTQIADGNSQNRNIIYTTSYTTEWKYASHVFTVDNDPSFNHFQEFLGTALSSDEWVEYSDFSVIEVDSVINRGSDIKTRFGRLDGVTDKTFGELKGYGAYVKRLYATEDVNIAGTLTAGDKDGAGASFYAGKIVKNLFPNSDHGPSFASSSVSQSTISILRPTGEIGLIKKVLSGGTTDPHISAVKVINHSMKSFTFSVWLKSPNVSGSCHLFLYSSGTTYIKSVNINLTDEWRRYSVTQYFPENSNTAITFRVDLPDIPSILNDEVHCFGFQLEEGENVTPYQPTDSVLSTADGYGMWANRGGFGGTIQNPILKLNEDGTIIGGDNKFTLRSDGSAEFKGDILVKDELGDEVSLISGGFIRTPLLDADSVRADIINVGYIEGLSLNFTKGYVGGWTIAAGLLSSGSLQLDGNSSIIRSNVSGVDKWRLNGSGSGQIASNNISWDNSGNVTFGPNVKLSYENIDGVDPRIKPIIYNFSGPQGCPINTTYIGGVKHIFNVITAGKGIIRALIYDAEGGVHLGLNSVDLGSMTAGNNVTKWYEFEVDLVTGSNEVSIWSISPDAATIQQIIIHGDSKSEYLTKIDALGIYTGTITANQVNAAQATVLGSVTAGSFNLGSGKFQVATDGTLTATGVNLSGAITASSGQIAGWNINTINLSKTFSGAKIYMGQLPVNTQYGFSVGDGTDANIIKMWAYDNVSMLEARKDSVTRFKLSTTGDNQIAGWNFDNNKLYKNFTSAKISFGDLASQIIGGAHGISIDSDGTSNNQIAMYVYNDHSTLRGRSNGNEIFRLDTRVGASYIAGWNFSNTTLSKDNVRISTDLVSNNGAGRLLIGNWNGAPHVKLLGDTTSQYVQMFNNGSNNWGLLGNTSNGVIFQLGSTNQIADWKFDNDSLYSGDKWGTGAHKGLTLRGGSSPLLIASRNSSSYVLMNSESDTDWGIRGKLNGVEYFSLGHVNQIAGWSFSDGELQNTTSLYYHLSISNKVTGTVSDARGRRGFVMYNDDTATGDNDVKFIRIGSLSNAGTPTTFSTSYDYGMQIWLGKSNSGKEIFRAGNGGAQIAGWSFDSGYLWTGTKQTTDAFSTSGITLSSGGAIRAKNFKIDTDGNAYFRGNVDALSGTIGGFTIGPNSLQGGISGEDRFALYPQDFLAFLDGDGDKWAGIGQNILPAYVNGNAVGRFEVTKWSDEGFFATRNMGIIISVNSAGVPSFADGTYVANGLNEAIHVDTGDISIREGNIRTYRDWSTLALNSQDYDHLEIHKSLKWEIISGGSTYNIIRLPTKAQMEALIGGSTTSNNLHFDICIHCSRSSTQSLRVQPNTGVSIYNNNGGTISYVSMAKGDSTQLLFDGSHWNVLNYYI